MLRVTIELVPHGNEGLKRTIGTMEISNVNYGRDRTRGDYSVRITESGDATYRLNAVTHIDCWPRLQKSAWELVAEAVRVAAGGAP